MSSAAHTHVLPPPERLADLAGNTDEQQRLDDPRLLHWAMAVFTVLWAVASSISNGFLESDAITHYLYARFALAEPYLLTDVWGRPLVTAFYCLPAAFAGRAGTQVASLLLALACAQMTVCVARRMGWRNPSLAGLLVLLQPLVFLHSFNELTELPFATLLIATFWAWLARRFALAALLCGLLPLGRPEGFGLIVLVGIDLLLRRRWLAAPLLLVGVVGWSLAGSALHGFSPPPSRWLIENWPYASRSVYGSGSLFHFVALLPAVTSPVVFPGLLVGLAVLLRPAHWKAILDQRSFARLAVALLPLGVLGVHSLLYFTGRLASSGEVRYLACVAPMWALAAAAGWTTLAEFARWRRPATSLAIASLAIVLLVNHRWRAVPLSDAHWIEASAVATWVRSSGVLVSRPRVMAAHPLIYYLLDISPTGSRAVEWHRDTIAAAPADTVMVWEQVHAGTNADERRTVSLDDITAAGWREIDDVSFPEGWRVFISQRPADVAVAPMP